MTPASIVDKRQRIRRFVLAKDVMGCVISHWSYALAVAEGSATKDAAALAEVEARWHEANDLWAALRPDRPAQLAAVIRWYRPWVKRQFAQS